MSREHFWPVWAAGFLPNDPELTHTDFARYADTTTGASTGEPRNYRRQGPVINRKVKTVCKPCNNGWMNRLETRARALLTDLATDQPRQLDADAQLLLLRWILMKVMASESDHRGDDVTFPDERRHFMSTLEVPSGVSAWIFRCNDRLWKSKYFRHSVHIYTLHGDPTAHVGPGRKNVQQVTFGFGSLLVTTVVSRVPGFRMNMLFPPVGAAQLWPPREEVISWPPEHVVDGHAADVIAANLLRVIRSGPIILRSR